MASIILMITGMGLMFAGGILMVSYQCTVEKLIYEFLTALNFPAETSTIESGLEEVQVSTLSIILLSTGGALFILALFSFIGTGVKALEKIVVIFYLLVTLALLGLAIYTIIFFAIPPESKPEEMDIIRWTMLGLLYDYQPTTGYSDDFTFQGIIVDMIQSSFHCCGANSYEDYADDTIAPDFYLKRFNMTLWKGPDTKIALTVPPTCCRTTTEMNKGPDSFKDDKPTSVSPSNFPIPENIDSNCYRNVPTAELVHTTRACPAAMYQMLDDNITWVYVAASIGVVVFLAMHIALWAKLCSCCGSDDDDDDEDPKKASKDVEKGKPTPQYPQPVAYTPVSPNYAQYPQYPKPN